MSPPSTTPKTARGKTPHPRRERGAVTLLVALMMLLALALLAGQTQQALHMEQRSAANQLQATQAFEAAEAGLAWAQAQLNRPGAIDSACRPSAANPAASSAQGSFSDRSLRWQAQPPGMHARTRLEAGLPRPLRAACLAQPDGAWQCNCPDQAEPSWPAPSGDRPQAGFIVQLDDGPVDGALRLRATGCQNGGNVCHPEQVPSGEARAELNLLLGLLPALLRAPAAPLTARQDILAGTAALGLHNTHPQSGGLLAHAGGTIQAEGARLETVAGEPAALAWAAQDSQLAALSPDALFITHFGLDRARWRQLPAVRKLPCAGDCAATLEQAATDGDTVLHLEHDLQLQGPFSLGSPTRPVLLVVDGTARLAGGVQWHGLIYAREIEWQAGPGPGTGSVHGALISESRYSGGGTPDLVWDREVLDLLRSRWGTWVPVPGGWRDH